MGVEIERRFLVVKDDWKSQIIRSEAFSQAYLNSSNEDWTTRIRVINNKQAQITLKYSMNGFKNYEFEYSIPIEDAIELMKLSKYKIIKTRYYLKINNKNWVVDVFDKSNSPLKIAEIELNFESEEIQIPSWCGHEITGIKSLSNASLAKTPISRLSVKDRMRVKESKANGQPFL